MRPRVTDRRRGRRPAVARRRREPHGLRLGRVAVDRRHQHADLAAHQAGQAGAGNGVGRAPVQRREAGRVGVAGSQQDDCDALVGLEAEGAQPARQLAHVAGARDGVLDQVAGDAALGLGHRAALRQLERHDGARLLQLHAIPVGERPPEGRLEHGLAGGVDADVEDDRVGVGHLAAGGGEHAAVVGEHANAAVDGGGGHRRDRVEPGLLEHQPDQPVVQLDGARELRVLLVHDARHRRLGDRDERRLVRHQEHAGSRAGRPPSRPRPAGRAGGCRPRTRGRPARRPRAARCSRWRRGRTPARS